MRLYLSSEGFGNHLETLHKMVGRNNKVLFVDNAKDYLPVVEREVHVQEKKQEFEAAGFDFYELDLREYRDKKKLTILSKLIEAAGLVWLAGGNTFILRRILAETQADTILTNALQKDLCVYGGSSAGSIVATKTLHGTENGDNPYDVPEDYHEKIVWDGLGLIYPQLVPHFQSDWFGSEARAMVDYFETNGMKYETLKDGEVYVVNGEIEEKLT